MEKFVQANTQELAKGKWLCPLSGKKFKGADFIRKHIFNKHAEKVAEVKAEAEYFNNYLKDPKRPMLPEHPGNKAPAREAPRENFPPYNAIGGYKNIFQRNYATIKQIEIYQFSFIIFFFFLTKDLVVLAAETTEVCEAFLVVALAVVDLVVDLGCHAPIAVDSIADGKT